MIPEAVYAEKCWPVRGSASHPLVIFGGFSPDSIAGRIQDCDSRIVITADEGLRGGRIVPLKRNVDEALQACPQVTDVVVVPATGNPVAVQAGRNDGWTTTSARRSRPTALQTPMKPRIPLFILYTSGSTSQAKGCCTPPAAT